MNRSLQCVLAVGKHKPGDAFQARVIHGVRPFGTRFASVPLAIARVPAYRSGGQESTGQGLDRVAAARADVTG